MDGVAGGFAQSRRARQAGEGSGSGAAAAPYPVAPPPGPPSPLLSPPPIQRETDQPPGEKGPGGTGGVGGRPAPHASGTLTIHLGGDRRVVPSAGRRSGLRLRGPRPARAPSNMFTPAARRCSAGRRMFSTAGRAEGEGACWRYPSGPRGRPAGSELQYVWCGRGEALQAPSLLKVQTNYL